MAILLMQTLDSCPSSGASKTSIYIFRSAVPGCSLATGRRIENLGSVSSSTLGPDCCDCKCSIMHSCTFVLYLMALSTSEGERQCDAEDSGLL